ncbi:MAG TPA: hypothetical protein VF789_16735 [Thermoanaerobaculia bacterium]
MKSLPILILPLLLICTGAALAQTPDGETPAQETVCDDETGAAYGLCNAYCEAMDCESDDPQASETACTRVKDKFTQITGRDLPCEAAVVNCPCEALPEWTAVLAGGAASCIDSGIRVILNTSTGSVAAGLDPPADSSCDVLSVSPQIFLSVTPEQEAACIELLNSHCPPAK